MRYWPVFAAVVGCSSGGDDDVTLDHSHHSDSGMTADCDGADPFVAGMSAATSETGTTVALAAADPTPPDVGDNSWTLEISDGSGPVEGLDVTVVPWMPLHGHGLTPADYAATDEGGGTYAVAPFDLVMPGLWEFRVRLGDGADEALFALCAEG
jgi:hypothetical protein